MLGLEDSKVGDQDTVYQEFKERLKRSPEGWYKVSLPWKANYHPFLSNATGSLKRLNALTKKLEKQPGMLERYDNVIQDQPNQGIMERVKDELKKENSTYHTNQLCGLKQKAQNYALFMMHLPERAKRPHP